LRVTISGLKYIATSFSSWFEGSEKAFLALAKFIGLKPSSIFTLLIHELKLVTIEEQGDVK
jgi:hypothetical protein